MPFMGEGLGPTVIQLPKAYGFPKAPVVRCFEKVPARDLLAVKFEGSFWGNSFHYIKKFHDLGDFQPRASHVQAMSFDGATWKIRPT